MLYHMESWHFWITLSALAGAIAFIAIQTYKTISPMFELLFLAILLHIFVVYGYTKSLSEDNSSILYAISNIMAIIFVVIIGKYIFKNTISTKQYIGLIIGIISLFLLM